MKFLELEYESFGLDINDLSVKIVKLAKSGKSFFVSSFDKTKIKPGIVESGIIKDEKALAEIIKNACKKVKGKKIKTKYVIASLPEEESFLQVIQMPKMTEEELKTAIVFEVENYIPLSLDQVYLDYQVIAPINDGLDHTDVLVVATPKKVIDSYISCLNLAGLVPLALEVESQSILRALIKGESSEFPVAVLDFGENNSDFIVFSGNSIRFTYSIPVSSTQLTQAISQDLNINIEKAEDDKIKHGSVDIRGKMSVNFNKALPSADSVLNELVLQIKKYLDFYQEHASHEHLSSSTGIQKIMLCGGGAELKGLPEFLAKKIGIKTEVADYFANMPQRKSSKIKSADFLAFATAIGLAQRKND